ncbi:N-acetylglucosamine kinase [Streptomyces indicus]|uniref:BadF-type ATPase n=1 Tax=Streptomyces indicus TaxID=417292 RepID=A0A1G9AQ89_9ACTN|nr:BadF/BadG/BcrA/BcrD ATPase family protein [Streptomyces indicus]SDK29478.1 BadF-type ATPase [Streptomyces indicus]
MPSREQHLLIGIDAGGTRTRAHCADAEGRLIGTGDSGPGNALGVQPDELVRHLSEAIAAALPEQSRGRTVAVAAGFAGGGFGRGRENAASCLARALDHLHLSAQAVELYGDAEIAFASGPGAPADGLVLIAGTGATAGRISGRREVRLVDGHGWLLGDEGSGFWLGRQALKAALRAVDGRGPRGPLVERVLEAVTPGRGRSAEQSPELPPLRDAIADWAYSRHPTALAALCPLVVEAAAEGDPPALALLDRAADELADKLAALGAREGELLVATGGLIAPGGPLTGRLAARVEPMGLRMTAVRDGGAGAVALAGLLTRPAV